MNLTPVMLQATCLWRRTLLAALEVTRIQVPTFSRRLGVEITVAHGLVNRLEKEGYCQSANKGKRSVVKMPFLPPSLLDSLYPTVIIVADSHCIKKVSDYYPIEIQLWDNIDLNGRNL